jgi:hypothetical protein
VTVDAAGQRPQEPQTLFRATHGPRRWHASSRSFQHIQQPPGTPKAFLRPAQGCSGASRGYPGYTLFLSIRTLKGFRIGRGLDQRIEAHVVAANQATRSALGAVPVAGRLRSGLRQPIQRTRSSPLP